MALVWLGVNAVMVIASAHMAARLEPSGPASVRWHVGWVVYLSLVWMSAIGVGTVGWLNRWSLLATAGCLAVGLAVAVAWKTGGRGRGDDSRAAGLARSSTPPTLKKISRSVWPRVGWCALAGVAIAHVIQRGLTTFPDDFDTLMYHLPIVVEWLQVGGLHAADSSFWWTPGNGEILALWMVAPFSGDFLFALCNVPFVVLWAIGSYRLCRELQLPASWSHVISMAAMLTFTTLDELDDCQNDIAIAALFISGAAFGLRFVHRSGWSSVLLMSVCVGALCGVKYNALGYAALVVGIVVGICWLRRRYRDGLRCIAVSAAGFLLLGSYWYVRNWLVSGSPIYPMGLGEDIGTGYPDLPGTTLWGNTNPSVTSLAWTALWRMTGPLHYGSLCVLPGLLLAVLIAEAMSRRSSSRRLVNVFFAASLLVGTGLLLLVSPFCVEDVPGTLNHLIWAYTPARYGLSFLTMILIASGIVIASGLVVRHLYDRWVWRRVFGSGRGNESHAARLVAPSTALAVVLAVLLIVQAWMVITEHGRQRRVDLGFEFWMLAFDGAVIVWLFPLLGEVRSVWKRRAIVAGGMVLLSVAIGVRSATWHRDFGPFYDRHFRTDLFTRAVGPDPLWRDRVMVLDMRCYAFYGSDRGTMVYRARSVDSIDGIAEAMKHHRCDIVLTHKEIDRDYYLYTHTYEWLREAEGRFEMIPTVGYYSGFMKGDEDLIDR